MVLIIKQMLKLQTYFSENIINEYVLKLYFHNETKYIYLYVVYEPGRPPTQCLCKTIPKICIK